MFRSKQSNIPRMPYPELGYVSDRGDRQQSVSVEFSRIWGDGGPCTPLFLCFLGSWEDVDTGIGGHHRDELTAGSLLLSKRFRSCVRHSVFLTPSFVAR